MIEKLAFGRTGHESTRIIFGAAALGGVTQAEADRTMETLLEYGVNHIDTAASYGESELRIGPWMPRHRKHFFLATKTGERTYQAARDEFHRSLERLQVDHVDLIQLHFLVDPPEWEVAMGPGGALEALIEAREQGLTRFIGVTGHELTVAKMHLRSLERFNFDSVLLPYNYPLMQIPQYAADFDRLQAVCQARSAASRRAADRGLGMESRPIPNPGFPILQLSAVDRHQGSRRRPLRTRSDPVCRRTQLGNRPPAVS